MIQIDFTSYVAKQKMPIIKLKWKEPQRRFYSARYKFGPVNYEIYTNIDTISIRNLNYWKTKTIKIPKELLRFDKEIKTFAALELEKVIGVRND